MYPPPPKKKTGAVCRSVCSWNAQKGTRTTRHTSRIRPRLYVAVGIKTSTEKAEERKHASPPPPSVPPRTSNLIFFDVPR